MSLNQQVRAFWEKVPCGTDEMIVGDLPPRSLEWFERVENHRYAVEPFIHSFAQFTRHHGKTVLEVGVGAGTDHLQWARAGAHCFGVDMTQAGVDTTRARLTQYGFESNLQRLDAEQLPFPDSFFDIVYSWGVIHHSEHPEQIISEIHRVLKPDGKFMGMMYQRNSLTTFRVWLKHALLSGRPWRTFSDVLWDHMESIGTKAYSIAELKCMFNQFTRFSATPVLTSYDTRRWPVWLTRFFPDQWGWFINIRAEKS